MKIGIIIRKLNVRGGVQRHVLSLAHALKIIGHEITIYTFIASSEQCYPALMSHLDIRALNYLPKPGKWKLFGRFNYFISLIDEARAARRLATLIDRNTEVLNPHDHVCYKVAYFFKRHVNRIPSVWTMHDMPTKMFSFLRANELDPRVAISPLTRFLYWLVDTYESKVYIKDQNRIAVLDRRDQNWVQRYFGKEAVVIRNGIDTDAFSYEERKPPHRTMAKLLMNGICMPHRRFEDGITALKILHNRGYEAHLTVVGSFDVGDTYFQRLTSLVRTLDLASDVTFTGEVSERTLIEEYQKSDIFIFPNHLQSWGLAVFEAMATGMPVVVSSSAGASEVLTHRENAFLVSPKAPEELAVAIVELIKNPDLHRALSIAGRRFVERELSWLRTARAMQEIFNACV